MTLKFVKTPVKRKSPATPPVAKRKFIKRKGLLVSAAKPRVVKEDYAIDQFGELALRKREAERQARILGHDLTGWHRRDNDPSGRWNNFCGTCNKLVVICTEPPHGLPHIYGRAVTDECLASAFHNSVLDGLPDIPLD